MRRVLVPTAVLGRITLGPAETHHLRDVLRLAEDTEIEVFDTAGNRAAARILTATSAGVTVEVTQMLPTQQPDLRLTIASAIPKGPRADWMIEKLSELGVHTFIPLATTRAIVLPRGQEKHNRWQRLATESARQSARPGVMKIEVLTELQVILSQTKPNELAYLSLEPEAQPIFEFLKTDHDAITLLIGPEGGWTDEEIAAFHAAKIPPLALTQTTLRIETAAIAAAAVAQSFIAKKR
jgi:16S rRNA (uracil1498-N3)-methyltransferase